MALSLELEKAIVRFFTYHGPTRVNKHLRILLMEALTNGSLTEQLNFQDILFDLDGIFELMDNAAHECASIGVSTSNEGNVSCL